MSDTPAEPRYLIWSNQHGMWWRANQRGYTQYIDEAGRYDRATAVDVVRKATLEGRLTHTRVDPITGCEYKSFDEVAVLAPEEPA